MTKNQNLIVEIALRDEKTVETYECVDFPFHSGNFLVLCLTGFRRKWILQETILSVNHYFK